MNLLIQKNASLNVKTANGYTAVYLAAFNDRYDILKILLVNGADADVPDNEGNTALIKAKAEGFSRIVTLLKNHGVGDRQEQQALNKAELAAEIKRRNLRPLGNRYRVLFQEGKDCNCYMALFRDQASAEKYYNVLIDYAAKNPSPVLFEVMLAFAPKNINAEKFAVIYPYTGEGALPVYKEWMAKVLVQCVEKNRQHNYLAGSYGGVAGMIENLIQWEILLPEQFSLDSPEAKDLLVDSDQLAMTKIDLRVKNAKMVVPQKPEPKGEWVGVLFEASRFEEALYGRAAIKMFIDIVGINNLAGTVFHGGDLSPDAQFWCTAVRTDSDQQAKAIINAVANFVSEKLAPVPSRVLRGSDVPVNSLPYMGFISKNNQFIGSNYY